MIQSACDRAKTAAQNKKYGNIIIHKEKKEGNQVVDESLLS